MGPHTWREELRTGGYSPYVTWARDSVDALWWLADVDDWAYSGERRNIGQHDPDTVDIAHVRWATSTAKTAIDLCAADAAVGHKLQDFWGDSPEDFARPPVAESLYKKHRDRLSPDVSSWLSALLADPDYRALKSVRDALAHRITVRSALIRTRPSKAHQDRNALRRSHPAH